MLNIYLTDRNGKLQEIEEMQKGCWINVLHPTEEEIQYLVQTLNVDLDFIKDPLDDEERSNIGFSSKQIVTKQSGITIIPIGIVS